MEMLNENNKENFLYLYDDNFDYCIDKEDQEVDGDYCAIIDILQKDKDNE